MKEETVGVLTQSEEYLPKYATEEAAGADLRACIEEPRVLQPGEIAAIPTGIKLEIPKGYEVQIRPRSGMALKFGVTVLNTPGTIDSDYRGEICVILINHSKIPFTIEPKMRIAQMVLTSYVKAALVLQEELATSTRGENRFGSTGTH